MVKYFPDGAYAVAVVGTASGIGRATALFLAKQGVLVGCLDRDTAGNEATAKAIRDGGGKAVAAHCDVTEDATIVPALDTVERAFGRLDGLVNCAGITGRTNIQGHQVDVADFDLVYRVNLRGAMLLSIAALPRMLARDYGRVLHVASIAGKEGNAGMAAYSATKAGLIGLVKSLGKDYATTGVTINALAPAVVRTPMVDALPEAQVTYMTDKIPMRRCGELDEVAHMIAWIVSPACSFSTGFTFDLSGGRATY
ncbi:MAG: SDR family oxidoreductase [Alphaproteobacteria bacterium]|nr:SDR family oxidoreductase [Alphaproteobacteria bacterium]